ncbi:class I SAM-dependent methyltransferase [Dactylosporangium matsuzakiense]|uniref:50S ribosomal protein L11 methyltransferase n=1 Tax=Dactylosporangium matsuzakiense TaxID=53360 RepID=A0A9W6KAP0_9ACTN|nr:50S ribosomal protein L11 methyltransferase [Dactylosporangium matsuzakiense]UWZ45393.1 methyltransferase [Dactylosporangium matsuzakiense]GLK98620.1 50S ribosomal protein L11 methyltransferase [Dactylosporangium matsuzakiense]
MRVSLLPEVELLLAAEGVGLFDATGGYRSDTPPPFWAFAWPGGLALARYLLDAPETVRGKRVVDLGTGSGVVAIAAALAGAGHVVAVDTDPQACAAALRNAAANGVALETAADMPPADVIVAGDVFYSPAVVGPVLKRLREAGAEVLVGDPGRGFLPERLFTEVAAYDVPVRRALEDEDVMRTTVWRLVTASASGPC